jgi:hypothetical protein
MPIKFKCPHCKKPLQVKDHLGGKKGTCPTCKKGLVIPQPAKATAPPNAQADAPPPETPPVDVDAIAAAALHDEPANGKQQVEVGDTFTFTCELCEAEVTVPRTDAGKRMQCPNPDCRSLIKVPAPKDAGPKKIPTVAQMTQVEKIDEAAWGTQTDKSHVHKESFKEAGALPEVKRRPTSPREWIQRGMIAIAVLAVLAIAIYWGSLITTTTKEKNFVAEALRFVEPGKGGDPKELVQDPVARAEVYRAIARYRINYSPEKKRTEQLDAIRKALASVALRPGDKASVERDLFLGDLALTMTELGGTPDEDRAKEKFDWKEPDVPKTLNQILQAIRAPEARVIAMRALATRLLEVDQPEIAISLAAQVSNDEEGRRPPATSQRVVLLLLKEKPVDEFVKPPKANEPMQPLARVAYAEFHARKGNYEEAKKVAFARGTPLDQLQACVGVADVILQNKNAKPGDAEEFVDKALELVRGKAFEDKKSPWPVLQAIRLGARVKGADAVRDLPRKLLPETYLPRALLEVVIAEADKSNDALYALSLSDIHEANANSSSVDLGWEVLARHNARINNNSALERDLTEEANRRYRAMVHIGSGLSGLDPRR